MGDCHQHQKADRINVHCNFVIVTLEDGSKIKYALQTPETVKLCEDCKARNLFKLNDQEVLKKEEKNKVRRLIQEGRAYEQ